MDPNSWARLSTYNSSSRRYPSRSADAFHLVEETDGDDPRPEYLCPFCAEDFDIVGLCCHIDEEHTVQAKNGVIKHEIVTSPRCARYVQKGWELVWLVILPCSMEVFSKYPSIEVLSVLAVYHLHLVGYVHMFEKRSEDTTENEDNLSILYHVQRKRRFRRVGPNSTLSILKKELREGNLQSLLGGSSFLVPSSMNTEPDPLLSSFMHNTAVEPLQDLNHSSTVEMSIVESSNKDLSARSEKHQGGRLSGEDEEEKGRRSAFVQGLLLSTFLDDDL
ncbi:Drought induced 19/ RING finger protein 114 [Cynara cardunculus var. scolymus]|uniref:Drought induced 19/ RING finger protein 114 n=1 Tax=Cynara cardunculus var. scolymus TaxID=59895 RepID=A0A103XGE0_CYNCS|nr:Drought induced 19/ RING finger protein 114 [Cynara cardunculus var. scolymus]